MRVSRTVLSRGSGGAGFFALLLAAGAGCGGGSAAPPNLAEGAETSAATGLTAARDTTVLPGRFADRNFGASPFLQIDQALIGFDSAELASAVAGNLDVSSATLEVTVTRAPRKTLGHGVQAFRMTRDWSELAATWDCAAERSPFDGRENCPRGQSWNMGPGTLANPWATPATATALISGAVSTLSFDVTADVRAFLDGSKPNFGWILKGSGLDPDFPIILGARESSQPPRLRISTGCKSAFADCDHDPANGCEQSLGSAGACGACGVSCDDQNPCTADSCGANGCQHDPIDDGVSCDDGDACTSGDACRAGTCSGAPVVCGGGDQCHAAGVCDRSTGACVNAPLADGSPCDDGDACTGGDRCSSGACESGAAVVCAASDGCHPGVCDTRTGACTTVAACQLYGIGAISGTAMDGLAVTPGRLEDGTPNNQIGGIGSAIAYTGVGNLFVATPDRGPNAGADSFTERYYLIDVALANGQVTPIVRGASVLDKGAGQDTFIGLDRAFDATNSPASRRLDCEGVRVGPQGTLFVSDEYGPFLYEIGADGHRRRALGVPDKFLIDHPGIEDAELPPANTKGRQDNRGMEGLAISPDGSKLYGIMQSPLIQDGALTASNDRVGINIRILEIDTTYGRDARAPLPAGQPFLRRQRDRRRQ